MFQLYHVADRLLPKVAMGTGREANWPQDYVHVANVELPDSSPESVYALTNNFEKQWTSEKGVFTVREGMRSTAPGDVVICPDGKVFRYLLHGYEELKPVPPKELLG